MNSVRGMSGAPSADSLFSVTSRGEVAVFDPLAADEAGCEPNAKKEDTRFSQEIKIEPREQMPIVRALENGFTPGTSISFSIKLPETWKR